MERPDLTRALLEHGANVHITDGMGFTPLHFAAWLGNPELIALLLDHCADPDARIDRPSAATFPVYMRLLGYTPLHVAAAAGQTNAIALLVQRGAALEGTNNHGLTPLNTVKAGAALGSRLHHSAVPTYYVPGMPKRIDLLPLHYAAADETIHFLRTLGAKATPPRSAPSFPTPSSLPAKR